MFYLYILLSIKLTVWSLLLQKLDAEICLMAFVHRSLKIPKGQSESVYQRPDNTMAKRYQRGNQSPYIKDQTTQWPKEKAQKDKQRSTKHTHKTKDQVTRTPTKFYIYMYCMSFMLVFQNHPMKCTYFV